MNLPQQRQRQPSCTNLLDGLARSVMSVDVPEARVCREAREQGRKDMRTLNEKLAAQLEKIRFLTEQNRKLSEQAAGSHRSGRETERLRQTYDKELHQLRQLVDGCEKEKADTLAKMATLQQALRTKQDHIQQLSDANRKLTDQLDEALKECSVKDADKIVLQRRGKAAEEEAQRLRAALEQSKQNNQQLHKNLDEETAGRMGCQAEMQTLREEMQFLKTVHEQELEELRSLINADREEDEDHWREEMQKAIHDIQTEYDQRLEKIRKEMDINYSNRLAELSQAQAAQNSRFQKLTDENAALASDFEAMRKRAEQLRAKCDGLEEALKAAQVENQTLRKNLENCQREAEREHRMTEDALNKALAELQALSDAKLNLESEIAAYRRLLEAQDSLFNDIGSSRKKNDPPPRPNGLRVRVPSYDSSPMSSTAPLSKSDIFVRWMDRDEPSGQSAKQQFIERKVEGSHQLSCSYSDSEKFNTTRGGNAYFGQLTLNECSPKGHFIELSNTGNRDVELSRWCLIRNIDQGRRVTRYTLPARTVPPHTTFRIWAAGKMGTGNGRYDFEAPYTSWGTGELVHTSLYSPDGVETATYVQTADFSP